MILQIATIILSAVTATTQPQGAQPSIYTAYTPDGAEVTMVSTDASTHDDDRILTADESAEIYISMERHNGAYTLYTIENGIITELMMYGWDTTTWADDIVAD